MTPGQVVVAGLPSMTSAAIRTPRRWSSSTPTATRAGWPDAGRRWSADYRVLAPDLRGHGSSPRFTPGQLAEPGDVFVADAVAMLKVLRRNGIPLGAIGHSLGGAALTAACALEPGLVDALVLIDPPWDTPVVLGRRSRIGEERRKEVLAYRHDPAAALETLRSDEPD